MLYNIAMGKITDITQQKRNKTRVSIYIDDEFVTGLDAVTLAANRVKIGDEITAEELKSLVHKSEVNSAFERAIGYLSSGPRARLEIVTYLKDKGYDKAVIVETVERLNAYHYIDDEAYARTYVKQKCKKYGNYRIEMELRRKGISQEIIDEVTGDDDAPDETDGALAVAQKYLRSHNSCEIPKLKRFLAARGFSWDSINSAVDRLKDDGAFDSDEYDD